MNNLKDINYLNRFEHFRTTISLEDLIVGVRHKILKLEKDRNYGGLITFLVENQSKESFYLTIYCPTQKNRFQVVVKRLLRQNNILDLYVLLANTIEEIYPKIAQWQFVVEYKSDSKCKEN